MCVCVNMYIVLVVVRLWEVAWDARSKVYFVTEHANLPTLAMYLLVTLTNTCAMRYGASNLDCQATDYK